MPEIAWLPWSAAAFARARAERKPVLLSIVTGWSQACRDMDATSYADPEVCAIVAELFVPVRVDADRRPDISERYSLGGWPTTAFLTADAAIAGGGTFVARERMATVLRQAAAAFATRGDEMVAPAVMAPAGALAAASRDEVVAEAALIDAVFATFDEDYGGFHAAPKFPLVAPIRLALHLHRDEADARATRIATVSLDAIGWGPLHDDVDGGFFRCADARNWEQPHREKLLDVNAALIDLFVDAAEILGSQRYADRAADALRYVQNWLADQVDGGWAGSQRADAAYYAEQAVTFDARRARPSVDRMLLADWNGAMASTALHAARAFQDDTLGAFAITSLERVLAVCYKPGRGVAHCLQGPVRVGGFLVDQFAVAGACLDALDASGNIVYEMMAEELARYAMRAMWDEPRGAFVDRPAPDNGDTIGLLACALVPFAANCQAATVLQRLAVSCGKDEFSTVADRVLAAVAGAARDHGPEAAHYLLARRAARLR